MKRKALAILALAMVVIACQPKEKEKDHDKAIEDTYRQALKVLASDDFLGRKPFTKGEELTVSYLQQQFEALGIEPGNGDSYFQDVPLVDITTKLQDDKVKVEGKKGKLELHSLEDIVVGTKRVVEKQEVKAAPVVFAGFGINAPEYDWNDYKDLDVKGKVVVVMVNDPGFYNPDLFRGKNMTYYGRWTYKYEEAARQGAAGVLIIHATAPASYGWGVVRSSWGGSNLYLQTENDNADAVAMEGWISGEAAKKLFDLAGADLNKAIEKAKQPGFKGQDLNLKLSATLNNKLDKKTSRNVVAMLPGTDLKDEYVIYSAHWDHFGVGEPVEGDSIYNGAADNASGTAGLLTLAKMFKEAPQTKRSIVFLSVTGEEQGLLGSEYYTKHPIFPIKNTVADINMDVLQPFGKMKDIFLIGKGQSNIDQYLEKVAQEQDRKVLEPEDQSNGWYYRSDHFNFAKVGIPTLYIANGEESIEHGKEWGAKQLEDYNTHRYHKPQDEYSDNWDVSGTMWDLELIFKTGTNLANTDAFPTWNEGVMYKKIREESRGK